MRSPSRRTAGRLADETNSPADFTHSPYRRKGPHQQGTCPCFQGMVLIIGRKQCFFGTNVYLCRQTIITKKHLYETNQPFTYVSSDDTGFVRQLVRSHERRRCRPHRTFGYPHREPPHDARSPLGHGTHRKCNPFARRQTGGLHRELLQCAPEQEQYRTFRDERRRQYQYAADPYDVARRPAHLDQGRHQVGLPEQ